MAQGAIQGAKYVTKLIKRELAGRDDPANRTPFKYFDKGSMATISRFSAVAQVGKLEFGGFIAWLAWLVLHLVYLVGFKNRFTTLITWFITFLGRSRGQMAITSQMIYARLAMDMLQNQQKLAASAVSARRSRGGGGTRKRGVMSDHTYRVIEIVGSSPDSIDAAIRNGISRASETIRGLDWFEVTSVRGHLADGAVGHFQVTHESRIPDGRRVVPTGRRAGSRGRRASRSPPPAGIRACAPLPRPDESRPPSRQSPPDRPPRTG